MNKNVRMKGSWKISTALFKCTWEQRKLSEVADIIGGGTPSTGVEEYWDGDIDWYAPAEINDQIYVDCSERKITRLGLENSSAKILPANKSILFTSRAGIGKTAILRHDGATNQGFQSMVLNDETNPYFVFSMSSIIKEKAERVASGSTFAEISGKLLGNLEFWFPSKAEQDKIGGYFENLDHLITLHQRKHVFLCARRFFDKLKLIDKKNIAWEQRKLEALLEKYEDPVETPRDGYERLGIRSHAKGTFHSVVEPGKELEAAKMHRVATEKFILNITFAWEHAVAITDENDAGKLVSHRFPQFSFDKTLKPQFFKYLMLDRKFREHLKLSSPGGAGRNRVLKISDMLKYEIKFPIVEEQLKIGRYFDFLDHLITLHQRKPFSRKNGGKLFVRKN